MNKNLVIGILAIILVLSFLWGQTGNRSEKGAKQELETTIAQLAQTETEAAKLQKTVQVSGEQLTKAQNDLVELRKANKAFEAKKSKNDAVVAALTREKDNLAGQINKMKNSPAVATSNNQQQIDALQKKVADLQAVLQTREQQLAAEKEILAETRAKTKKQRSMMWIKSEVGHAEPGVLSTEELQAKLAKAESSTQELQEKLVIVEGAVHKQKQQLVAATEELAETRAKVKGDYSSRVWIKSELTPVEQETQEKKELQAELAKIESSVHELQEKLAVAEQGAQRAKELQVILAKSESSVHELREKLALVEQGPQSAQELQEKFAQMESSVQELQEKLAVAEQGVEKAKELEAKLAESESSVHELQEKLAQAESINQELQGKLEESVLSIRDLGEKVAALNQANLTRKYEALRAQVMGFELMVEEKNADLEEMNKKLDHWKINKDLLLTTISEQQERVQKLQDANRGLLRDLAAKKKELAEEKKRNSAKP